MSSRARLVWIAAGTAVLLALAAVAWGAFLWSTAQDRIDRRSLEAVEERDPPSEEDGPSAPDLMNVLVVGSDSRQGLTSEERRRLSTGDFGGGRADTILLVQVRTGEDGGASVVSFPRDLRVDVPDHGPERINATLEVGGPDALVTAVEDLLDTEVDHYIEVAIPAFLSLVEAVGPIEVCLDEPLRDPKSGADLGAGCHDLGAVEALAYVRSRQGDRGDLERIDRQQQFIGALLDRVTSAGSLLDPSRLYRIVTESADSLTTDEGLGLAEIRTLAAHARDIATGDVATATVPNWAETIDGVPYQIPYEPGVEAIATALDDGVPPRPDVSPPDRSESTIALWSSKNADHASRIESVLYYAGFVPEIVGTEPQQLSGRDTVVYHPDDEPSAQARWVGSILGARARPLPDGVTLTGADAIVKVGAPPAVP